MMKEDPTHEMAAADNATNDGEDFDAGTSSNSSAGAKSGDAPSFLLQQEENQYLAYPKCKQKEIMMMQETGEGDRANKNRPTPNQNDDQVLALACAEEELALACAEEELENKRKANLMADDAGQPKKVVEVDRNCREIQKKKEMDMEKSNSFNIISVVQERISMNHSENELDNKRKAKLMDDGGQPKTLGEVERNSREIQKEKEMNMEKSDTFNILSVVQERISASHADEQETSKPRAPNYSARQPQQSQRPGAYAGAPGKTLDRVDNLRFSLLGRVSNGLVEQKMPGSVKIGSRKDHQSTTTFFPDCNKNNDKLVELMPITEGRLSQAELIDQENLAQEEALPSSAYDITTRENSRASEMIQPTTGDNNNNEELLEARLVEEDYRSSIRMEAQLIDQDKLDRKSVGEAKYRRWNRFGCGFVAVALIVLAVSLSIGLTKTKESTVKMNIPTHSPTSRLLPPMNNLDLLYDELPAKTKEMLYNTESPQYQAWIWLLYHPNIAAYPEWRKKQVFAMAAFFYSFEGPSWPKETPGRDRWMSTSISECYWMETEFIAQASVDNLGPDAYGLQEYQPCNRGGQLQSLIVDQLYLPTNAKPLLPPEIELLTSLKIMAIIVGQVNSKLSDLMIPELIQLPSLAALSFYSCGVSGSIPKELGAMTGLRHLLLGVNQLTSTIPTAIGKMTSLEHINLGNNVLSGFVPSQLGFLTSMTSLELEHNHFSGPIPSEVGSMTNIQQFWLGNNALTESIPSELGLMANIIDLRLGNDLGLQGSYNEFSSSLPGELWELSHVETFWLSNLPTVSGSLPNEIMMPNLTSLSLSGSPHLSGTISETVCSVQELNVDCSNLLCGCHCPCIGTISQNQKSLP